MTRDQHLTATLAEECNELAKACMKALRFGLDDGRPDSDSTNEMDMVTEFNHIVAVARMLTAERVDMPILETVIADKIKRVEGYLEYAERKGAIEVT